MKSEQTAGTYFMDKKKWMRWINASAESIDWTIDICESKGLKTSLEPGFPDPDEVIDVPPASHNFYNDEQPFGALFGAPLQAQAMADAFTDDFGGEIHTTTPRPCTSSATTTTPAASRPSLPRTPTAST